MAELVTAPTRKPRSGGIKSVVGEFTLEPRLTVAGIAWEDAGCGFPHETRAGCYDDVVDPEAKEGDGVDQHESIAPPFARYKGVDCFIGGDNVGDSYVDQAKAALEAGEDREVESQLFLWADAVTITADSGATISEVIAAAEEAADTGYVGQPVLFMSRHDAALAFAEKALVRENGVLVTGNGTPVIASGVFPDNTWGTVFILGAVEVYATPVVAQVAHAFASNHTLAIAERVYAIGVDCDYRAGFALTTP